MVGTIRDMKYTEILCREKGERYREIVERIKPDILVEDFMMRRVLEYLGENNVRIVAVVGLQTDYCIDATIKCGFEHGFKMIVPENANSTFDNAFMTGEQSYKYYNEFMWKGRYAECISVEETIERMKAEVQNGRGY